MPPLGVAGPVGSGFLKPLPSHCCISNREPPVLRARPRPRASPPGNHFDGVSLLPLIFGTPCPVQGHQALGASALLLHPPLSLSLAPAGLLPGAHTALLLPAPSLSHGRLPCPEAPAPKCAPDPLVPLPNPMPSACVLTAQPPAPSPGKACGMRELVPQALRHQWPPYLLGQPPCCRLSKSQLL